LLIFLENQPLSEATGRGIGTFDPGAIVPRGTRQNWRRPDFLLIPWSFALRSTGLILTRDRAVAVRSLGIYREH
jgi:hypothetical protein